MFNLQKKALIPVLLLILIMSAVSISKAAPQVPEKVRIGLNFDTTCLSTFTVSAEKGLQLGAQKDNAFTVLYEENTGNSVTIRKDAYYTKSGNGLTEYSPGQGGIPQGEKIGPYHVKIGGNQNDLAAVNAQINDLKQKGIAAYAVYVDGWQVWTGFYIDNKAAQDDIANNIEKKLGKGTYEVIQPAPERVVAVAPGENVAVVFGGSSGVLQIHPKQENNPYSLKLGNGRIYRGDLEVRRLSGSDMTLINIVPFEQYLYGVVPSEMQANSHMEALKAQAVASRSYAINTMGKHEKHGFNLCSTTHCHVYKGLGEETPNTNKAVDDTKGKNVIYNGKTASVFYFSSSGGRTESNKYVWGFEYPYLQSVEDKYESGKSHNYNWEKTLTAAKIKEIMVQKGFDLGDIFGVKVTKRSEAGRAAELIIDGSKEDRTYVRGDCRNVFSLDSQWYNISTDADAVIKPKDGAPEASSLGGKKVITSSGVKTLSTSSNVNVIGKDGIKKTIPSIPTSYKFSGKGWGHAIGMSQEGAKGMANAGFTYDQILTHYFPGTKVE